jgi:hypothetical protein
VNSHGANTQATEHYFIGSATSLFSISGLQVPLWPVVATIGLALLVILPSGYVYVVLTKRMSMPSSMALIVNHAVMLVIALPLIAWFQEQALRPLRSSLGSVLRCADDCGRLLPANIEAPSAAG